jgi:hypothetical protein
LFTDAAYGGIDLNLIEAFLKTNLKYVQGDFGGAAGMGRSYLNGTNNAASAIKLGVYYSMDPFYQEVNVTEIQKKIVKFIMFIN